MNKPYFTKYLPVEGEIKEGDRALLGKTTITNIIDKQYLAEIKKNKKMADFKKVKLFLCSRDIQVGDTVRCLHNKTTGVVTKIVNQANKKKGEVILDNIIHYGERWFTVKSQLYKVIGEISPNAIWVKEADEFSEDEWIRCTIWKDGTFVEHNGKDATLSPLETYGAKIKGPCGHFH